MVMLTMSMHVEGKFIYISYYRSYYRYISTTDFVFFSLCISLSVCVCVFRPTVIQKCSECGVEIGGLSHNLLPGNEDLDEGLKGNTEYSQVSKAADKSEKGYTIVSSEDEQKNAGSIFQSVRDQTPLSARFQR